MNSGILPINLVIKTSTKDDGSMHVPRNRVDFVVRHGLDPNKLVLCEQIHGNSVAYVTDPTGEIQKVDALFTDNPEIALAIRHADCFPVAAWAEENGLVTAFGIAHSGFEGAAHGVGFDNFGDKRSSKTAGHGVAANLVKSLKNFSKSSGEINALIGPGVCQKNYEIRDNARGLGRFSEHSEYKKPPFLRIENGRNYLDLKAVIVDQILKAGVSAKNIIDDGICNYCDARYFSHRRGDRIGEVTPLNMTIIGIR